MIKNYYFLCLLVLVVVYFFFRNNKFYFRHAYLNNLSNLKKKNWFSWQTFILVGCVFFVLAACDISWQHKELIKTYLVHKYVLVNDGSGSMVLLNKENGIGNSLSAVLAGNDVLLDFLGKRQDGSKDLVGAIVFSSEAFTVSNLCDDPEFVKNKLKRIDYRLSPLAQGTDIEAGLWAALEMLLSSSVKIETLNHLQRKFYGEESNVKRDDILDEIILKRESFVGNSIIIFTDGGFDATGRKTKMSTFKIIDFCALMGIKVYFISVDVLDNNIIKFCSKTGGKGEIITQFNNKSLEDVYYKIVTSQANEYTVKEEVVNYIISDILGVIGLCLVFIGLILHHTSQLSFTEL